MAGPTHRGEGTYYDLGQGTGNCSFDPKQNDLMGGAMNQIDYATAAACGACVAITGPKGTVTVRILDRCPECKAGDIDLNPAAFQKIADLSAGRIPISWHFADCTLGGTVQYHFKDGSSPFWTAVQVRNHATPVATFSFRTANGGFQIVPRVEFNYFIVPSGMGNGPYTFRVTDTYGETLEDTGIQGGDNTTVTGRGQFAGCSH